MDSGAVTFFAGFAFTIGFVVVLIELVVMCVASLFSRKERNMFADQIKAGAKLLDEKVPEWLEKQDLEKLDLSDPCNCVVGQACSDVHYVDALANLFREREEDNMFDISYHHGFTTEDYTKYPQLTSEWKSYIQKRRKQDQKSTIEQVP